MRRDRLTDLRVRLREIERELRRTVNALDALALKGERAELRQRIRLEQTRRPA